MEPPGEILVSGLCRWKVVRGQAMFENFRGNNRKIRAAAGSFGLDHTPYRTWSSGDIPEGIDEHVLNLVETTPGDGVPDIMFGNAGIRFWYREGSPDRRGLIVLHHRADLPHMYLSSDAFGSLEPLRAVAMGFALLKSFSEHSDAATPSAFTASAQKLSVPKDSGFKAVCEPDRADHGQALLTGEAMPLLSWLARSFDLEVRGDCLIATNNYRDISTDDREVWEWAFSTASRLIDLVRLWGADPDFGACWELYTSEWIERPRKLDGALSLRRWSKG